MGHSEAPFAPWEKSFPSMARWSLAYPRLLAIGRRFESPRTCIRMRGALLKVVNFDRTKPRRP
jgi:hypothetical protein